MKKTIATRLEEDVIKEIENQASEKKETVSAFLANTLTLMFLGHNQDEKGQELLFSGVIIDCPLRKPKYSDDRVLVDTSVCMTCPKRNNDETQVTRRCSSFADYQSELRLKEFKRPVKSKDVK